jgi:geranylgeranyl reductase family protein
MTRCDVLVVGAGPAGAVAARAAARAGARVLLVEQGDGTGDPARCTGLVSPRTQETLGFSDETVLREIRGGIVHSPGGRTVEIHAEGVKGLVLDRQRLRRELTDLAAAAGVEVRFRTRAAAASRGTVRLEASGKAENVSTRVTIGADGPRSAVGSWFSLAGPSQFLRASQAVVAGRPPAPDAVEVFLGSDVAPGFFAWSVPAEEGRLRVGLATATGNDPEPFLARLLARRFPGEALARAGGLIPIGPAPRTADDGVLLVGDAAGQAKPASGGGIYTGSVCAGIAGEIAGTAALAEMTSRETLGEYERRWQKAIGEELRFGGALHRARLALSDSEVDAALAAIDEESILQVIAGEGDLDYPSRLVRAFADRRDLWLRLAALLPVLTASRSVEEWLDLLFVSPERASL